MRIAYADLARIAGMHVNDVTGAGLAFPEPRVVTRGQWAVETLDAYRPLFTDLATSLGQQPNADPDEAGDPMMQMMAGLNRMLAPAMLTGTSSDPRRRLAVPEYFMQPERTIKSPGEIFSERPPEVPILIILFTPCL